MLVIGLTGGIGSGKTSVLQLFINKGIPVYIADIEAKRLMVESPTIRKKMIETFGKDSYIEGKLNRSYIAAIVFGNEEELAKLNAIVHPVVHADFLAFKKSQIGNYLVYENAILFENGSDKLCDYIITVTAPIKTRIARVVARDSVTKKQVQDRMQHQWDDALKIENSDFTIENIDWETTKEIVNELHNKLLIIGKE